MEKEVSRSIARFAARFCKELGTNKTSICSPLSAETVLALLALGCKDQAHAELLQALEISDDDAVRSSFAFITSTLKSIEGATLNTANKLYLKKGAELKAGIKKDAEEVFQSSLEQLDFNDREAAADVINKWVAQTTNDKIKDVVSPDMLDEKSQLVLVNAMYFQGAWAKTFPHCRTRDRPFHVNNTTTILVPQMATSNQTWNYGDSEELQASLLEMKYGGGEVSMVIVLPDEIEGLSSVLEKLASGHNLMADMENMKPRSSFDIAIPKFTVETTINMKELLPKMGIKSIFDKSDIDMLESDEKLFVSEAIQKALIIVDEEGTEARTCVTTILTKISKHPNKSFEADRPFLYLLTARQIPLFIGVYGGSEYASPQVAS